MITRGTPESHYRVWDLQHPWFNHPCGLQILDTQMEFSSPSLNIVTISIIFIPNTGKWDAHFFFYLLNSLKY